LFNFTFFVKLNYFFTERQKVFQIAKANKRREMSGFSQMCQEGEFECVICLEEIGKANQVTTPCGHKFCFQCISHSMFTVTKNTCPYCRTRLVANIPEEESGGEESDDEDVESESDPEEDRDSLGTADEIAKLCEDQGYSMADIIAIVTNRYDHENPRYAPHLCHALSDGLDEIIRIADEAAYKRCQNKLRERQQFASEDLRNIV